MAGALPSRKSVLRQAFFQTPEAAYMKWWLDYINDRGEPNIATPTFTELNEVMVDALHQSLAQSVGEHQAGAGCGSGALQPIARADSARIAGIESYAAARERTRSSMSASTPSLAMPPSGAGISRLVRRRRIDWFPYLLMAPGLLLVLFVTLYPMIFAIDYSLMKTKVFKQLAFVGFANYQRLIADPRFLENLLNSVIFVGVGVALAWVFGLALALFLRRQTWQRDPPDHHPGAVGD